MRKLTGIQKVAILLVSLGIKGSSTIYKHLKEEEVELLTKEIATLQWIDSKVKEDVLNEFYQMASKRNVVSKGGEHFAKDVLALSFGEEKANEMLHRSSEKNLKKPFYFAHRAEPVQILNLLQYENSQTIALVLSYLDSKKASAILSSFSAEKQTDIATKIALMDTVSPEVVRQVEEVLQEKLATTTSQDYTVNNGIDNIVNILTSVDRGTEKHILEALSQQSPSLADEIKGKMFIFEDIALLDNYSIQRILRDVDSEDLYLALKIASEDLKETIFRNISKRRVELLEEQGKYDKPVRMKEAEEAQGRIVRIVRKLEEEGSIIIERRGGEAVVV
ncbi:flagellar motor switch protein FliG [Neobacillus soli]|uniref:flagellar motor switch protein FliG n=1 Tax=Neobacillus soli TaxID=220688 RepID=UPI000826B239|nr:flagellar motor switch protein FliG [Neobacillus soli]